VWSSWWNENRQGKLKYLRKPTPVSLCPPQIPYDLTWAWTRATTVGSQQLTTWAMAQPKLHVTAQTKNMLCRYLKFKTAKPMFKLRFFFLNSIWEFEIYWN
jgi:hypothetical protein